MKFKFLNLFTLVGISSLLLSSCIKDDVEELGDAGRTFLKFAEAPENSIFFDPFTDIKTVGLFSLNRDASSEGELNKAVTVKIKANPDAIEAYNDEHGTNFEVLPETLYTIGSGITQSGDVFTLNYNSGEFAKEFVVNLDGSQWDLSKQYALAFSVVDSAGIELAEGKKDIITFLAIKNAYDGKYSIESGSVQRYVGPVNPETTGNLNGSVAGNPDLTLATVGPNTVEITGLQWAAGSNSGVAGIDNLRLTVDPATNQVTMFSLGNASLANWEGHENYYDPATKTFHLAFRWNPTGNRREYEMVIKYKGPR